MKYTVKKRTKNIGGTIAKDSVALGYSPKSARAQAKSERKDTLGKFIIYSKDDKTSANSGDVYDLFKGITYAEAGGLMVAKRTDGELAQALAIVMTYLSEN